MTSRRPIRDSYVPKKSLRLLFATSDDDVELIATELRRAGFELIATRIESTSALAVELSGRSWDLVISDWQVGELAAADVIGVVRASGADLPIIVVSSTVGEDTAVDAMKRGAHDFLVKDKLARLVPAIERELRDAHVRRERRRIREQLRITERMASVGLLAAGVAHEINNPLAAVLANIDLSQEDAAVLVANAPDCDRGSTLVEQLADARDAAIRIRDIVRDLRLFSRSEDDQRTSIDPRVVMESALRMAWNEIRHRAQLVREFRPVPPVEANESRLGQVFLNLVVNAAQAIPEGRAQSNEIKVSIFESDDHVVIEVRDTGCGMTPEVRSKLFTPFFTTKPIGIGTGLGLSICHRIVAALGGEITVDTEVDRGSTFRVRLPAAVERIPTGKMTQMVAPGRRARILVIDDESAVVRAANRILGNDHDVTTAERADEALAMILSGQRFDLILCDLMMPDMTGMDLHGELMHLMPEQGERMVFLTGGAFTARARAFLDRVSNPHYEKPFDADMLRSIVHERIG